MSAQVPEVSVVIPVWGREHNLPRLLPSLSKALRSLVDDCEILVAAGPASGLHEPAVIELGGTFVPGGGSGYGEILQAGLARARGRYVITMDADYSHRPGYIRTMWSHRDQADVLIASRYVRGSSAEMSYIRRSLSWSINWMYRKILALPYRDLSSGFRMFSRAVLDDIGLPQGRGLDVLPEMVTNAFSQGWKIQEVPFWYRGARPWTRTKMLDLGFGYLVTIGRAFGLRNSVRAADYDHRAFDSWIPLQRYWQRRRFRVILDFVDDSDWVLDIGCGSSRIVQSLPRAIGLDLAARKLRWLRAPGRHLVQGDMTRLPFADRSLDAVICSEVIEHVPRDDVRLEELVRVIRPGGRLIVGTPDYGRWRWRALESIYGKVFPGGYVKEHINRYTYDQLRRILERDLGLDVRDCRYVGGSEMIFQAVVPVEDRPGAALTGGGTGSTAP
jgi:dolichol-phosphate mannosyltransferase